jgi:Arc/MetJ-type ribon-helix-helix transcriptional regulator
MGKMPQITVTIPDEEYRLLAQLVVETGRSRSGLVSEYVKRGIYEDVGNINKGAVFWSMQQKRAAQRADAGDETPTEEPSK